MGDCAGLVEHEEGVGFEVGDFGADVLAVGGVLGQFLQRAHTNKLITD